MTLAVLPELKVKIGLKGTITLTQKFIDGMLEYLKYWDGPVTAYMQPTEERSWNLDEVEIDRARLPFKVEVISFGCSSLCYRHFHAARGNSIGSSVRI